VISHLKNGGFDRTLQPPAPVPRAAITFAPGFLRTRHLDISVRVHHATAVDADGPSMSEELDPEPNDAYRLIGGV